MKRTKRITPLTVQTGQNAARTAWIEIAMDPQGKWHWLLWSGNGRPVARNPVEYEKRKDAIQAAKSVHQLLPSVQFIGEVTRVS